MNALGTAARRWIIGRHRPQLADLQPRLLDRLAAGHFLGLLLLVDQTGHGFHQPGVVATRHRTHPELFDQHHLVALGVVGQHAHGVVTHEKLALDLCAHAATEQSMTQPKAIQAVKAAETAIALDDFHVSGSGFENLGHCTLT